MAGGPDAADAFAMAWVPQPAGHIKFELTDEVLYGGARGGGSMMDSIRKRTAEALAQASQSVERSYGWRKDGEGREAHDVIAQRIRFDLTHNPERVAEAHRELRRLQDMITRPMIDAMHMAPPRMIYMADPSLVIQPKTRRINRCDCPGCAPSKHRWIEPRADVAAVANFMRVSDAAARCADDDKRWGATP